jgi:hypothetical protein
MAGLMTVESIGQEMEADDDTEEINTGPWTAIDEEDLRESLSSGASLDDVASFLCRDLLDVAQRASALGLKWQYSALLNRTAYYRVASLAGEVGSSAAPDLSDSV